jgi:MFS family permease
VPALSPVLTASLIAVIGLLPVFLLGPTAVLMRADLDFSEAQLGLGVSTYFAAAALCAAPSGRLVEQLGDRRTLVVAAFGCSSGWPSAGS